MGGVKVRLGLRMIVMKEIHDYLATEFEIWNDPDIQEFFNDNDIEADSYVIRIFKNIEWYLEELVAFRMIQETK